MRFSTVCVATCAFVASCSLQASINAVSANPPQQQTDSAEQDSGSDSAAQQPEQAEGGQDQQHGPGPGRGMGRGFRGGRGPGAGGGAGDFRNDMTTIHSMFDDRTKIRRIVKLLPDGAMALTESDDKRLVPFIQDHVPNMDSRVVSAEPLPPMTFHPVFVALIKNADKYTLDYEETDKGVKVTYQSDDPFVVMLVQEHAKLVSRFIANGHAEIHADYELPKFDKKTAAAQAKALTARDALFGSLSGRLTAVMKDKGPVAAIDVCSKEAKTITQTVSKEQGVKIGRTALKLRNDENSAPPWAAKLIKKSPTHGTFVDLPEHRVGALLPIRLQSKCVVCHGPSKKIGEDIATALSRLYPNDKAAGFKEGDLRGWFWVEVAVD